MSVNVKEVHGAGFWGLGEIVNIKGWFSKEEIVIPQRPEVPLILKKIRWCESRNRQFNIDGTVHRGKLNPQDVGAFQINEYYHLKESIRLEMDIYTLEGNEDYAMYLYKSQGTRPWSWSSGCHDNNLTLEELKRKYP